MTWAAIVALAAGAYGLKVVGLLFLGEARFPPRIAAVVPLIPVALLAALIVVQTFSTGRELSLDARALGIAAAAATALGRLPFPLVIGAAALVTAGARAFS